MVLEWEAQGRSVLSMVPAEVIAKQQRRQHKSGLAGVLFVSAQVPQATLGVDSRHRRWDAEPKQVTPQDPTPNALGTYGWDGVQKYEAGAAP